MIKQCDWNETEDQIGIVPIPIVLMQDDQQDHQAGNDEPTLFQFEFCVVVLVTVRTGLAEPVYVSSRPLPRPKP